jgi:hypothetical protein
MDMPKIKVKSHKGVTLMELMMAIGIAAIVMFGVAIMLADNLSAWRTMYSRLHSNTAEQCFEVRRIFDRVIRSACVGKPVYVSNNAVTVDYLEIPSSGSPYLCRANFNYSGNTLTINCIRISNGQVLENMTIPNITQCNFTTSGRSIQMLLTANNTSGNPEESFSETINIAATAFLSSWQIE